LHLGQVPIFLLFPPRSLIPELLYRNTWPTRRAARTAIFEYIEGFYNSRRRHSALGYLSPAEFEEVRLGEEDAA
jgi:transposase InsO family protein